MSDVQRMGGSLELSETMGDQSVLTGSAPVSQARDYALEVAAYISIGFIFVLRLISIRFQMRIPTVQRERRTPVSR